MELEDMCYDVTESGKLHCQSMDISGSCSITSSTFREMLSSEFLMLDSSADSESMELDSIQNQDDRSGLGNQQWSNDDVQEAQGKKDYSLLMSGEISGLKGIHDELMEESSVTDLLLTGAEAVESGNRGLAATISLRLNAILSDQEISAENDPLERLALYFSQALLQKSLLASPDHQLPEDPVSACRDNISAFQMLLEISPYVKFAHFTANQAILEASQGHQEVHVIDFDIMEGIQWPPLMVDLAVREDASLRITAVVTDQRTMRSTQMTGRRLQEFADSINLHFMFDQVLITKEDDFERIGNVGDMLIANCMINQLYTPQRGGDSMIPTFISAMRRLSPKIIVVVEDELLNSARVAEMSFIEFFCEALQHYSALSESISSGLGAHRFAARVIEKEFLGVRILESVKQFPCEERERQFWGKDGFHQMEGFKRIPLSSCNVTQAKFLVSLFNVGYWVQNENCRLALCWKSRPLTKASVWVPDTNQGHEKPPSLKNISRD